MAPGMTTGDSLESALMPGKVIKGHAKLEAECKNCHVRFNKAAQTRLCLDCHKDAAQDVQGRRGHHGRITEKECRVCHTDHKGRDANIAPLDESSFDHRLTDFELKGAHASAVACRECHKPSELYRDAPSDCNACHRKDDKHKGSLGKACADCHLEKNWKETRFDHSKTRFALTGKHVDVACQKCHTDPDFKRTPTTCVACHKKDDKHKARFGTRCESCHADRDWKIITFDHERQAKYALRGKHRVARCETCHTGLLYRPPTLSTTCVACHRTDDEKKGHKGQYGEKCQACHTEKDWKTIVFNHDRDTKYPLRGKHVQAKCTACHTGNIYKDKVPTVCNNCHARDDKHRGQLGKRCESCHNESKWTTARFDHGLSRFPLLGKHARVECKKCHLTPAYKDARSDCYACHKKDDTHKLRLGPSCEQCHNVTDWRQWNFNHDRRTKYKLDGKHKGLHCHACHKQPAEKSVVAPTACVGCHSDDDVHDGGFSRVCERCHVTGSFKQLKPGAGGMRR